MYDRLQQMEDRYVELGEQMALPEIQNDREAMHKISKAHRDLEAPVEKFRQYKQLAQGVEDARLMATETDPEIAAMAAEELAELEPRREAAEAELKILLLPKDPNDDKNVVLEIRAGTGGDEASLFVAEVFRM